MNSFPPNDTRVMITPRDESFEQPSSAADVPKRKLGGLTVAAGVLIAVGVVAGLVPRLKHRTELRAENRELAIPTVTVTSPAPGKASSGLVLPAEVRPLVEAPIYARASGYLKKWHVDIGAPVEAGQLLAEIDTPELNQELARTKAELQQAEAALELAKTTAKRWADLLKTASVSEQEAAEKQADLALKSATVAASRANVGRLEDLQSFSRVVAPFAGTITARRTDVGELINATSGKELFRLAQTGKLRVYVHAPQSVARFITPGQSAELTIPEMPGRTFEAKVVRTSGAMTAESRTLLTELEVDNAKGEILAGTYAQVRLSDAKPDAALTVPAVTLLFRSEGPQLAVVRDGKVEMQTVVIGRDFGPTIEILEGIKATDHVVLNPPDSIVSGVAVHVVEPSKADAAQQHGHH